jgi:hypothetical protein
MAAPLVGWTAGIGVPAFDSAAVDMSAFLEVLMAVDRGVID